jgi:hypothetical protein
MSVVEACCVGLDPTESVKIRCCTGREGVNGCSCSVKHMRAPCPEDASTVSLLEYECQVEGPDAPLSTAFGQLSHDTRGHVHVRSEEFRIT